AQPEYACRFEPWVQREAKGERRGVRNKRGGMQNEKRKRSAKGAVARSSFLVSRSSFHVPRSLLRPPCLKPRPVALSAVPSRSQTESRSQPPPGNTNAPNGPPRRFRWQGQDHAIARFWGPERIETGWWRGRDIRRDYYLVETTTGQRFWLFQNLDED